MSDLFFIYDVANEAFSYHPIAMYFMCVSLMPLSL